MCGRVGGEVSKNASRLELNRISDTGTQLEASRISNLKVVHVYLWLDVYQLECVFCIHSRET